VAPATKAEVTVPMNPNQSPLFHAWSVRRYCALKAIDAASTPEAMVRIPSSRVDHLQ
jgi:hypothetical protein